MNGEVSMRIAGWPRRCENINRPLHTSRLRGELARKRDTRVTRYPMVKA